MNDHHAGPWKWQLWLCLGIDAQWYVYKNYREHEIHDARLVAYVLLKLGYGVCIKERAK